MHLNNINPIKLKSELENAGIVCVVRNDLREGEHIAPNTWLDFAENTNLDLAQQIIDAHDPALAPVPTKEEILEQELANTNALILELTELIMGGM